MVSDVTERDAIWSVPAGWQKVFFWLFTFQLTACLGLVIWYHVWQKIDYGRMDTFFAIGQGTGWFIVPTTAITFVLTELSFMFSEEFLRKRFERGKEEGKAVGLAQGFVEAWVQWETWNKRRIEAEVAGEKFDEPPPPRPRNMNGNQS